MNSQSTDMIPTKASASFCDSMSDIERTFLLFPLRPRGFVMRLRVAMICLLYLHLCRYAPLCFPSLLLPTDADDFLHMSKTRLECVQCQPVLVGASHFFLSFSCFTKVFAHLHELAKSYIQSFNLSLILHFRLLQQQH